MTKLKRTMLYIANARIPTEKAHGLQIMKTCEALAASGIAVDVLIPREDASLGDPFSYYGVSEIFNIHVQRAPSLLRLGRIGFILQSLWFGVRVVQYARKARPDIIYSRDAITLFVLQFFGLPFVYEAHTNHYNRIVARVLRKAHKVVTVTNHLKGFYVERGVPDESICVAPNGFTLVDFDALPNAKDLRKELGLSLTHPVVLYTGHLYEWKGAHVLADAARNLSEAEIVFVGGTDKDIADFRARYHAEQNVRICGRKPHATTPRYLHAADVAVLPNIPVTEESEFYTAPIKLFEYMASGTPIVASDLPSIREIINEQTAFFTPPGDAQKLAETITFVLENADEARRRARNARRHVQEFSWGARARRITRCVFDA